MNIMDTRHEEVIRWMRRFLQNAGYELQHLSHTGQIQPDFHAKRQVGEVTHEIAGIVCPDISHALEALARLKGIKAAIGKEADYTLLFPPVSEYSMIDFLTSDRGKRYFDIKQERFMVWICNPERETTTCLIGGPQDSMLNQFFVKLGTMSFDALLIMRLSHVIIEEEEKDEIERS